MVGNQAPEEKDRKVTETCIVHVCTSCRPKDFPREPKEKRPGYLLFEELRKAIRGHILESQLDIRPAECLSVCPRPCGIAISRAEAWTYLFGDQDPQKTVRDILDCVLLYQASSDGCVKRESRPLSMRAGILGRVPPL